MQLDRRDDVLASTGPSVAWPEVLTRLRNWLLPAEPDDHLTVRLYDKPLQVHLSPSAITAAATLTQPLTIELELYFSCFVRKAVRFYPGSPHDEGDTESHVNLHNRVHLHFRPVTTQHCLMDNSPDAPPLEVMPLTRPQAFLPRWVKVDHQHGLWSGEFGY